MQGTRLSTRTAKVVHILDEGKGRVALCGTVAAEGQTWLPAEPVTCQGCRRKAG